MGRHNDGGGIVTNANGRSRAGAVQAIGLVLTIQMPIVPIMALAPNLPLLFRHFAATPGKELLVPMIITLPSLGIVLLGPVAGMMADRWGRRRLLLWALALFGMAGVAPVFLEDLRSILTAQAVLGIAEAVIMTNANTLLGDYFPAEQRNRWLGVQSIIGPFFAAVLTLAAGFLGTVSWHAPFAVLAIAFVIWVWMLVATWEPQRVTEPANPVRTDGAAVGFPWKRMFPVFAITVLTALIFYVPTIHFGLIYDRLGAHSSALISILTTTATLGSVLSGYYFRGQKQDPFKHLVLIYLAFGLGLVGLGLAGDYWTGLAFGFLINFGFGLTLPALVALVLFRLPESYRGRGMGLWMSCFFCAQFLCPPLFAMLMHGVGGLVPALEWTGAFCLLFAFGSWIHARRLSSLQAAPVA
jgi:MFS family permease